MPDRNNLGGLRRVGGVTSVHHRVDGVSVVWFSDGTAVRIPAMTYAEAFARAAQLERKAIVMRVLAQDRSRR